MFVEKYTFISQDVSDSLIYGGMIVSCFGVGNNLILTKVKNILKYHKSSTNIYTWLFWFQEDELTVESLEAYERDLESTSSDSSVFEHESVPPRSNVLSTFVDGVLGKKRKGDEDLLDEVGPRKRPQVVVSVKSDAPLSPEAEHRIEPIVKSEIKSWFESGKAVRRQGFPEHEILVHITEDTKREPDPVALAPWRGEVVKKDVTVTSMGPFVKRDIEVETNLHVQTSPPVPDSPQITRTRIWKTTTRETVTSIKQETRTEVEMLIPEQREMTSNLYVYGAASPPEHLEVQVRSRKALENISDTLDNVESTEAEKMEQDMKNANEGICRRIEDSLAQRK